MYGSMTADGKTARRGTAAFVIISILIAACLTLGCLGGDKPPEEAPKTSSGTWTPPERAYVKSIDTSRLLLGTPSDAAITIFNNGNETVTNERIVMTAVAVKMDDWKVNMALKTKSEEEKTETYELKFDEQIKSNESCELAAQFNLPAKIETDIGKVSISGIYHATIKVYADDTLIGTKEMDLHLKE